ncbi:MAG: hypothetical protein Q8P77_01840 [Candidatus Veblenbacteria bacterium]|nr:hypothetical protein [Candidatus Veblenbacteria bacterium]
MGDPLDLQVHLQFLKEKAKELENMNKAFLAYVGNNGGPSKKEIQERKDLRSTVTMAQKTWENIKNK